MDNYAEIVDGIVVNVSIWDGETPWSYRGELVKLNDGIIAGPGWAYVEGVFAPPVDPEEIA